MHVYLSPQRHGEHLDADVQALLAQLRQRDGGASAAKLGDPFLLEPRFDDVAAGELARRFGADFETALRTLPTGEWSGPVPSSYGMHVVFVRERSEERTAALADVRDDVGRKWVHDQREQLNDRYYADLRKRYEITVEQPSIAGAGGASKSDSAASK